MSCSNASSVVFLLSKNQLEAQNVFQNAGSASHCKAKSLGKQQYIAASETKGVQVPREISSNSC
jgi:hypothetical protein